MCPCYGLALNRWDHHAAGQVSHADSRSSVSSSSERLIDQGKPEQFSDNLVALPVGDLGSITTEEHEPSSEESHKMIWQEATTLEAINLADKVHHSITNWIQKRSLSFDDSQVQQGGTKDGDLVYRQSNLNSVSPAIQLKSEGATSVEKAATEVNINLKELEANKDIAGNGSQYQFERTRSQQGEIIAKLDVDTEREAKVQSPCLITEDDYLHVNDSPSSVENGITCDENETAIKGSEEAYKCFVFGSVLSAGGSGHFEKALSSDWANMADNFQKLALEWRLGTPIIYGIDAVHRNNSVYGATILPLNVNLGATRDPDLARRIAGATSLEVRLSGFHYSFASCVAVGLVPIMISARWNKCYDAVVQIYLRLLLRIICSEDA
ncbi:hypothetical protein Nepgr_000156 [Nepenthes gracilis]|uniref:Glycoside hydrolase family 3 N-terminal domain-containing protein n=1 Tax=Nepenthes gracilis TaxID=150966 RepID=A0AAD3P3G0_NEPGR|nr:hypothetical protein Nepgr_000156 [Nepenthes gracilis]